MKKLLLSCLLACLAYFSYGQSCSPVPVKEAVRNGDFEVGYPQENGKIYSNGKPIDFYSDLEYAGDYTGKGCWNSIGDKWGIGKEEPVEYQYNCCSAPNNPYAGCSYGINQYKDHTTGTKNGFSLIADVHLKDSSSISRNGNIIIWQQEVNIFPAEVYYFSAWLALYGNSNPSPQLEIDMIGVKNGIPDVTNGKLIPVTGASLTNKMEWKQFTTSWTNDNLYEKVILRIQITNATEKAGQSGLDFAIDDISFINSPINIGKRAYEIAFEQKEQSLCLNNGEIELAIKDDQGNPLTNSGGKSITWYKGTGNLQEELTAFANETSITVSEPTEYRACVLDPINGDTAVFSNILITEKLDVQLENVTLCSPSQILLDDKLPQEGFIHNWTGAKTGTGQTILADKAGEYTVTVSHKELKNCTTTVTSIVTSNLPTAPTNLTYCTNQPTILTHPDTTKQWKWCEDMNCTKNIGVPHTFTTTGEQTVYLQNISGDSIGITGPSSNYIYPSSGTSVSFSTQQKIVLKSIQVRSYEWTGGCQGKGSKDVLLNIPELNFSKTITVNCGEIQTIDLNITIPKGDYTLETDGTMFYYSDSFDKNNNIENFITINDNHSVFANWEIYTTKSCNPIPVTITEDCLITNLNKTQESSIEVVPNPFENNTTISINTPSNITLYDVNGHVINTWNNQSTITVGNNLSQGIYFISIQNEHGIFHEKIIKQ